jgi:hypothetical protein
VCIKTKPKEIVFYETKTNEKFRKEFLYLSLISNTAEYRVSIMPKIFDENSEINQESEDEKSLKKKKSHRYLYQ